MNYKCWGKHAEDLSDKVEQALAALPDDDGPTVVYGLMSLRGNKPDRGPRKIMVTCGEGHENVFEIDD
jgi:hypothetical protein